jgi:CheY-like chemotaxis protein
LVDGISHASRPNVREVPEMKKILFVEDNEECRKMLTRIIGYLGYDVIQADFLDGSCRATSEHPDLILISLDFPRMWGLDVTRSLKSNPQTADIPILVYPPWDSEEITEAALNTGATEVLKEPFTLQSFRQVLQKYASFDTGLTSELYAYSSAA